MPSTVFPSTHRALGRPSGPVPCSTRPKSRTGTLSSGRTISQGLPNLSPLVSPLHLMPTNDVLSEDAELIADAVTDSGVAEGGHRVEEASCQSAQAAIPEPGVGLHLEQVGQGDAQLRQRLAGRVHHPERKEVVPERATEQVLGGEVADSLDVSLVVGALGRYPTFGESVAHGHSDSHEPVQRSRALPQPLARV